jgi:CRAL/TRIO, N-terminal domain
MIPETIEDTLCELVSWIEEQPELPQYFDKILLIRYLKASDFNVERAKILLKNSLKWRKNYPHIFTQRDPLSEEMQKVVEYA